MPIHQPGKVLLHHIPLKFVHDRVSGGGKKSVDQNIPLVPFIDFLITLVVFLLMSFSASGELLAQKADITMPKAANTDELKPLEVIAISKSLITYRDERVADYDSLMQSPDAQERIEPLIQKMEQMKRNWSIVHPNEPFTGEVIVQADEGVDFRVLKKILFNCSQAGYINVSFLVNAKEK